MTKLKLNSLITGLKSEKIIIPISRQMFITGKARYRMGDESRHRAEAMVCTPLAEPIRGGGAAPISFD